MKILVVGDYLKTSNAIRPEVMITIGLANKGHDITVFTRPNSAYTPIFENLGIKVIEQYPTKKICLNTIKMIRAELRTGDYDIVYALNSKTIPNAAFACIGFPVKMVNYRGTTGGLYRHDPSAYLTHLHPRVDGIICVSNAVTEDIQAQVWKNKDKVVTIYKGHDPAWYQSQPSDLSEFGIPEGAFVAIAVANVRPTKGLSVLLEAVNKVAHLDNFHLLLVGSGMDKEPYLSAIKNSALGNRIHVTGYRTDAPELMAACNILVQASISGEGLPRTVMEAMSYGVPSIVTVTGGSKEVVVDGVNGCIVPVKDALAIADKIEYLYNNEAIVSDMSVACKQRLAKLFTAERTVDEHIKYFESLLD
ncbi:Poly(glycerol-phosphate) alpha-glucosyltransferase [Moritella sp. JT01]|uniref:glycosyltransferase family 4 protein n=1 Tax=Moritella sp. JT01 TaxID=756698 RepID=UPI00079A38FC|nr:glycosyltransferase family 4 protein [Moritella sp. JT01]KXO13751.1 Poly(glycerol-phosphate) alpha-glucosyltransferase [Moritella sp. JT01]